MLVCITPELPEEAVVHLDCVGLLSFCGVLDDLVGASGSLVCCCCFLRTFRRSFVAPKCWLAGFCGGMRGVSCRVLRNAYWRLLDFADFFKPFCLLLSLRNCPRPLLDLVWLCLLVLFLVAEFLRANLLAFCRPSLACWLLYSLA